MCCLQFEEAMEFKPHIEQVEREVAAIEAATTGRSYPTRSCNCLHRVHAWP